MATWILPSFVSYACWFFNEPDNYADFAKLIANGLGGGLYSVNLGQVFFKQ